MEQIGAVLEQAMNNVLTTGNRGAGIEGFHPADSADR